MKLPPVWTVKIVCWSCNRPTVICEPPASTRHRRGVCYTCDGYSRVELQKRWEAHVDEYLDSLREFAEYRDSLIR